MCLLPGIPALKTILEKILKTVGAVSQNRLLFVFWIIQSFAVIFFLQVYTHSAFSCSEGLS